MKTTIETINDKQYTVLHFIKESLTKSNLRSFVWKGDGSGELFFSRHYATALPALPRHPKPEDARLLYRYMAEGVKLIVADDNRTEIGIFDGFTWTGNVSYRDEQTGDLSWLTRTQHPEIIEATAETGERVEIAINEGDV